MQALEAGFTGMNTRAGDILSVRFDHNDAVAANYATSMHILLHAGCILQIQDSGCSVSH